MESPLSLGVSSSVAGGVLLPLCAPHLLASLPDHPSPLLAWGCALRASGNLG